MLLPQERESGRTFEALFKTHFKGLHAYAATVTKDADSAEDIVQNTFLRLWKLWEAKSVPDSPAAYLYRAVYNESLNLIKHEKVKMAHQQYTLHTAKAETSAAETGKIRELESKLDAALQTLPEQCRTIFQMSRFEELKYREIAGRLGLSVKTIEAQMGKALRIMRVQLADCLPALLIWFLLHGYRQFLN